jgi:hypothetical protein
VEIIMHKRPLCKGCSRQKNPSETFFCIDLNQTITKEKCLEKRKDKTRKKVK